MLSSIMHSSMNLSVGFLLLLTPSTTAVAISSRSAIANAGPAKAPAVTLTPNAACGRTFEGYEYVYTVGLGNWTVDARGCGRGLLDNLRGQCGAVSDWECQNFPSTLVSGVDDSDSVSFALSTVTRKKCVKDALYLASGGQVEGVDCADGDAFSAYP